MLLNSFQADQQETFTTLQEFEDVLLNDPNRRIGDNFVDDILDSAWLKAIITSLFPDSKEGSRQSANRYIHAYIYTPGKKYCNTKFEYFSLDRQFQYIFYN